MSDIVRYGIIGTGMMGQEHIANIALLEGARVTAIADSDAGMREQGRALAPGDVRVREDYRDVIADPEVDVLVIATPNFTHFEVLQHAFASGKHILVEKPMCTEVDDCHRVVEMAERHPALVWVALEYRYMRSVDHLIGLVDAGAVGALRMLFIREHRNPFLVKVGDWNRFNRNTGGTLVEKCCHFFDLMHRITRRRPLRVFASGAQDVNHLDERYGGEVPDILDNAFAVVDFEDGLRGCLDLCMFAEGSPDEVEITATGDIGKVQAFEPRHEVVVSPRRGGGERRQFPLERHIELAGWHHGATYYEHLDFLDCLRHGRKPTVGVADGALSVAVGAAAQRSIAEGRAIAMSELGF